MNRALLFCLVAACSNPDPADDPSCRADALESDISYTGPLAGPGVDAQGKLAPPASGTRYTISSTYLRLGRAEASTQKFQEKMAPIAMQLMTQPGLVAVQFSFSDKCRSARTLTVWEGEGAMIQFVTSPAHGEAVGAVGEMSRGGSIATHWSGSEAEASWTRVTQQLAAHTGPEY